MPPDIKEQYLIALYEIMTGVSTYIVVPSNNDFALLLGHLNPEEYVVLSVTPLGRVIDFDEFLTHIRKKNKPKGLNFGSEE